MIENKRKYSHFIWDWNGTLFDDAHLCTQILNGILKRYNKSAISFEDYQREFGFPVKDYYAKLGFDFEEEPFEVIAAEYIEDYNARRLECGLRENAMDVIHELKAENVTSSILSAYEQKMLEEMVDHFGIREFFENIVGMDDHYAEGKIKNGKDLLRSISEHPEDVVLVGDTVHDYEVASVMGVDCILVASGHQSRDRLEVCGAAVVETLSEAAGVSN